MTRAMTSVFAAVLVSLCACSDNPCTPPVEEADPLADFKALLAQTPRPDREAEEMALWISGDLVAPESLYTRLRDGLADLRYSYVPRVPELGLIRFISPYQTSSLTLKFDSTAAQRFLNDSYDDWDSLNSLLPLDTVLIVFNGDFLYWRWVVLLFEGRLNPEKLTEMYSELPGVELSDPSGYAGDRSNLYPWIVADRLTFLLCYGWGDCPAGCIYSRFWYFKETANGFELVGEFTHREQEPPEWWPEASESFCKYMNGFYGLCK